MRQAWRWFGPSDPISLEHIRQAGAEDVVTALHDVPAGVTWSAEAIREVQARIENAGLEWGVAESIWMDDEIKLRGSGARKKLDAWKDSLANLGRAGIGVVCYNFMPVVDWTRTDLAYPIPGRGRALRFDFADFVAYDAHVLKRSGAEAGYPTKVVEEAGRRFAAMGEDDVIRLERNIIAGLPGGSEGFSRASIAARIAEFDGVTPDDMRANLRAFLAEVLPVAEEFGVKLAIHPDDPPFSLFGLPRIVSTADDLAWVIDAVASPVNGLTFCTGSLGARADNDLVAMAREFGDHIHFAHLRNVQIEPDGSFHEAEHFHGSTDLLAVLRELVAQRRDIPFRPDHGHLLDFEEGTEVNPGYSYLGRFKGLAELRGAMMAFEHAAS